MFKSDLAAAHARIETLERALADSRHAASPLAPPAAVLLPPRRPVRFGRAIVYQAPETYWPLIRQFISALRHFRVDTAFPPPRTDSAVAHLGYYLLWPWVRVIGPVIAALLTVLVVLPSIVVTVVPFSVLCLPFAVLGGLKVASAPRQPRDEFWSLRPERGLGLFGLYMMLGMWGTIGLCIALFA